MKTTIYSLISVICLSLLSSLAIAKDIKYVSDQLTIPMRTGTTMNHKILKFLQSGMAVEILEQTDDQQFSRIVLVEDETKSGWVETSLLMPQPSAREQLERSKKRMQSMKDKQSGLKKELSDVKRQNADLQKVQAELESKITSLQDTLSRLRKNAAEPIRIADENEKLLTQLEEEQAKNKALEEQNAFLGDQNIKQWFMIGAAVSIGSLLLGILLTRINWRRKDSWAGSF